MKSSAYFDVTRGFAIDGNYAYVGAAGTDSLTTVDISKCISDLDNTAYYSGGTTSGSATYLYYGSCVTYVGSTGTLSVMDGIGGVQKQGDYIYTSKPHGTFTLSVVDVSTPASPTVVATVTDSSSSAVYYFVISGNHAFAASHDSHALIAVDISTPTAPTIAGRLVDTTKLSKAFNVAVSGN